MIILSVTMLAAQIAGAWLWPPTAPAVEAAAIGAARATVHRIGARALDLLARIPGIGRSLSSGLRYLPRLPDQPGRIAGLVAQPLTTATSRAAPGLYRALIGAGYRESTALFLAKLPASTVEFLVQKGVDNVIWAGGLDVVVQGVQIAKGTGTGWTARC